MGMRTKLGDAAALVAGGARDSGSSDRSDSGRAFSAECVAGDNEPVTLRFLIEDYLDTSAGILPN